ncbi:hypothetical protein JOM56_007171 [Amanita muscaria]
MDSTFSSEPPIFTADFAFIVIFAAVSVVQLVLVLLLTVIKMTRKQGGAGVGTVTEQEVGLLRLHRTRFALLMALTLISIVAMYSTQAVLSFFNLLTFSTYLAISVANNCLFDFQNVFLFAVLIAVLDSGIKVSQLRRHDSTANALQGTNVNIIVMSCLVGFLLILTIARIALLGLWDARQMSTELDLTITAAEWWAHFGLGQVRTFIDVVLAIYYTVVAILMWKKVHMVPSGPNEADKNYSFRVLHRISRIVCPVLLLSTVSMIILDVLGNTIASALFGTDYLPFAFAYDFTSGVLAVLLNFAIISVGYVL